MELLCAVLCRSYIEYMVHYVTIFMLDSLNNLFLNLPMVPIGLEPAQQQDKQYHLPVFFIIAYSRILYCSFPK